MFSEYSYKSSGYKKLNYIISAINLVLPGKKCKILEIGCGNGNISTVLASYGHEVLGIDLSEDCIEYANYRKSTCSLRNVVFKVADAEHVQNTGELFDVVICSEVLEHLYAPESVLSAICNVLLQDGILIVTVPNGYGPFQVSASLLELASKSKYLVKMKRARAPDQREQFSSICEQSKNTAVGSKHVQFFTRKHLCELFKKAGFRLISSGCSDFIAGAYPFNIVIRKSRLLCGIDFAVADLFPASLASGWYFTLKKAP
jgi:2-polyprenyl-3-methyl-5-hydroxy-6-metoxy-1,4-benzoquinol methylase